MSIEDLTIREARQLAAMFGGGDAVPDNPHIGKKCIIRAYASGVHFGELVSQNGRQVELRNARRLWSWHAKDGISLSEVSATGVDHGKSKIAMAIPEHIILDAIEIIPAQPVAVESIETAPVASK